MGRTGLVSWSIPFISKSVPLITGYFNPLSAKTYVSSNLDSDKNVDSYVYSVWSKIASITKSNLIAGLKSCAYNLPSTLSIPSTPSTYQEINLVLSWHPLPTYISTTV